MTGMSGRAIATTRNMSGAGNNSVASAALVRTRSAVLRKQAAADAAPSDTTPVVTATRAAMARLGHSDTVRRLTTSPPSGSVPSQCADDGPEG